MIFQQGSDKHRMNEISSILIKAKVCDGPKFTTFRRRLDSVAEVHGAESRCG
jgi:hypothetical protein